MAPSAVQRELMNSKGYDEELYADLKEDYSSALDEPRIYTQQQRDAISVYTGPSYGNNGYKLLNRALRRGDHDALKAEAPIRTGRGMTYQQVADHLNSAMDQTRTRRDMVVYRGIKPGGLPPVLVGDEITDHGFISTSMDPGEAQGFSYNSAGTLLEISLPKGTPALRGEVSEHELILKPGTRMRVVEKGPNGHIKVVLV